MLGLWRTATMSSCLVAACAAGPVALADHYKVSFARVRQDDDGALRLAQVEATLTPENGRIRLARAAADSGLYHGWAGFLTAIEGRDAADQPLRFVYETQGVWRVEPHPRGDISLRYALTLQHDRFRNEPGDDELAYARPYGVMWTTRALFMEGAPSENVTVAFDLPEGWRVSTPWRAEPGGKWTFRPKDADDLLDAAFMAGRHHEISLPLGKARALIALAPPVKRLEGSFTHLIRSYFGAYARLFSDWPKDNFLLIGGDASFLGGGVMGRTISLSLNEEVEGPQGRLLIAYIVAHEGFHLWNVRWRSAKKPAPELEWLAEGSAEYYGLLTSLRLSIIDQAAFLNLVAERYSAYRKALQFGQTPVSAAATKNASQASYDLIYGGGTTALLFADLEIRRATGNRRSLDDVVRALHARFADERADTLSLATLETLVRRETGYDFAALVRDHIRGSAPIDLTRALESVGLKASIARDTVAIGPSPMPSRQQRDAYAKWVHAPQ